MFVISGPISSRSFCADRSREPARIADICRDLSKEGSSENLSAAAISEKLRGRQLREPVWSSPLERYRLLAAFRHGSSCRDRPDPHTDTHGVGSFRQIFGGLFKT
ncbi:hypothetical protein QR680_014812 [Steinernema hermaphroditum]|uniref:Uncharacterized protein n=1 Tax=Steinernema hermaphroditum TaxID=289476 RepID=A0AA39IA81_9BILA|nr:hypothetical protein QR680_014812 [Steinernema hermaphroditum]